MAVAAVESRWFGSFGTASMEGVLADLFAVNVLLQIVDGFLTYNALPLGFNEGNPLIGASMLTLGPATALLLFKAKACGLLILVRRGASPVFVARALQGTAIGYAFLAIIPWIGKLLAVAAITYSPL